MRHRNPLTIVFSQRGECLEEALKYVLLLVVLTVGGYLVIGVGVDAMVTRIPASLESKLLSGLASGPQPTGGNSTSTDPRLAGPSAILKKIDAQPEVPKLDYRLFLIREASPNAVAMPGGAIGVTAGLLDNLNDEIGLAFVLGHELGHFKNRDHLRGVGRSIGMRILLNLIFGDSDISRFLGANALTLMHRKYSRTQEDAADRFGVYLVYKAYGSTKGADRLFEILQKNDNAPGWAYMYSTHPATKDRIAALKKYAAEIESRNGKAAKPEKDLEGKGKTNKSW